MGFFDSLFRKAPVPTMTDPTFGVLRFEQGGWHGSVAFVGASEPVDLAIYGAPDGPTAEHRRVNEELMRRYAGLRPAIGEALWKLYGPPDLDVEEPERLPKSAAEMLTSTILSGIHFEDDGRISLYYGFVPGIWDDASLEVVLEDWVARPGILAD